jgi:ankyrin repeat protein
MKNKLLAIGVISLLATTAFAGPIHDAIMNRNIKGVQAALDNGADVNAKLWGYTPLHVASQIGDPTLFTLLINNGADVNARDDEDYTALHYVAEADHSNFVKTLIDNGANVNAKNEFGDTPLDLAVDEGNDETADVLRKLGGKAGKDVDEVPTRTIHDATGDGDLAGVQALLDAGAKVDAVDEGWTPLMVAASNGHKEIANLLIANGANVNAKDAAGRTPLYNASWNSHWETAELLIAKGANVNAKDSMVQLTSLHFAATEGRKNIVELLLAKGADVNAANMFGGTPLMNAAWHGHSEIAVHLVENGANINAKDQYGMTPLHYAAEQGSKEIADLLISKGADINAKSDKASGNQTPLDLAQDKGVIDLLREHGGMAGKDVNAVPKFMTQPESLEIAKTTSSVTLTAEATPETGVSYQWFKNSLMMTDETSPALTMTGATADLVGDYYIQATNKNGSAKSRVAVISLIQLPPTISSHPKSITVEQGLGAELSVKANGDDLTYQWYKGGTKLEGETGSDYTIAAASSVDAGDYHVIIMNTAGETVSDTATVQVTIEIVTAFTQVLRSTGSIALKYKISPPHYYQVQSASTLNFTGFEILAQQNSTGLMENIVVQNDYSEGARFFRIALTEPQYEKPTIVTEPTGKTVESGNPVRFEVVAQSDTEASYKWFKNGEVIVGQVGAALIIPAASVGDAGDYTVEVTNKGGSIVTGAAKLDVKAGAIPPVITQQPVPLELSRNSNGTLSVAVSGSKPFQFQWYRNGNKIMGATNSTYKIVGANPAKHGGKYKVKITNAFGSVFSEEVLVLVSR